MKLYRRGNKESFLRAMSCMIRVLLPIALLLVTAHRLPAPIVEEPTPAPEIKTKPKRHAAEAETEPKPRSEKKSAAAPAVSFAGTWTGRVSGEIHAPLTPPNYACTYKIQISADEKTANWTASRWLLAKFQAPIHKSGRTLTWSCERHDLAGKTTINASLQMNPNGTAAFTESSGVVNGMFQGSSYKVAGTLVRQ
jgi:hypothetical protein